MQLAKFKRLAFDYIFVTLISHLIVKSVITSIKNQINQKSGTLLPDTAEILHIFVL